MNRKILALALLIASLAITAVFGELDSNPGGTDPVTKSLALDALPRAEASTIYLPASIASASYLLQSVASGTFLQASIASASYLLQAVASTTFLTPADASAAFLLQSVASSTFLTPSDASAAFLLQSVASGAFLAQSEASATYLPAAAASASFLSQSSATGTFVFQSVASSTFLSQEAASASYQPIGGGSGSFTTTISQNVASGGWISYQGNSLEFAAGSSSVLLPLDAAVTALTPTASMSYFWEAVVNVKQVASPSAGVYRLRGAFTTIGIGNNLDGIGSTITESFIASETLTGIAPSYAGGQFRLLASGPITSLWQVKSLRIGGF